MALILGFFKLIMTGGWMGAGGRAGGRLRHGAFRRPPALWPYVQEAPCSACSAMPALHQRGRGLHWCGRRSEGASRLLASPSRLQAAQAARCQKVHSSTACIPLDAPSAARPSLAPLCP